MARSVNGWDFWEIANPDGSVAWLGLTREGARSAVDRQKVWTLMPSSRMFVANWFVTEDHLRRDEQIWEHHNIDITEARDLLLTVPQPTVEDIRRLGRPEAILTLDQLDKHAVLKVMGKTAQRLLEDNR